VCASWWPAAMLFSSNRNDECRDELEAHPQLTTCIRREVTSLRRDSLLRASLRCALVCPDDLAARTHRPCVLIRDRGRTAAGAPRCASTTTFAWSRVRGLGSRRKPLSAGTTLQLAAAHKANRRFTALPRWSRRCTRGRSGALPWATAPTRAADRVMANLQRGHLRCESATRRSGQLVALRVCHSVNVAHCAGSRSILSTCRVNADAADYTTR
jgi:hypothetical protein